MTAGDPLRSRGENPYAQRKLAQPLNSKPRAKGTYQPRPANHREKGSPRKRVGQRVAGLLLFLLLLFLLAVLQRPLLRRGSGRCGGRGAEKEAARGRREEEGKEEEKEDRRPAGRRVCAVIFSLGDCPGAAGVSFPLPLVWSSSLNSTCCTRRLSL